MSFPDTISIKVKVTPSASQSQRRRRKVIRLLGERGLTLVEVAIALGIFAFAIIPVIGLMETALKVSKESIDSSTTTQIFRLAKAQIATNTNPATMYFSVAGEDTTTNPAGAAYQANFTRQTNDSGAAQGLLVRNSWQVRIVRADATNSVFNTRVIQISRPISTNDF